MEEAATLWFSSPDTSTPSTVTTTTSGCSVVAPRWRSGPDHQLGGPSTRGSPEKGSDWLGSESVAIPGPITVARLGSHGQPMAKGRGSVPEERRGRVLSRGALIMVPQAQNCCNHGNDPGPGSTQGASLWSGGFRAPALL